MLYPLARTALFALDPEVAHEGAVLALAMLARVPPVCRVMESLTGLPRSLPPNDSLGHEGRGS